MDDFDDTKSLLQAFPFLCDDESSSTEQPSSSQPSKDSSPPLIQDATIDDVDIFIDLPIDFHQLFALPVFGFYWHLLFNLTSKFNRWTCTQLS